VGVSLKKIIGQLYLCYNTVAQCSSSRVEVRVTTDRYESDRIRSCFFKFSTDLPSRPAALLDATKGRLSESFSRRKSKRKFNGMIRDGIE
jgi:hypothetical protein